MKEPSDVACGACAQQPGEPCKGLPPFPPINPDLKFHVERIEAAKFINAVEQGWPHEAGAEPRAIAFRNAVLATGLF